MLVETVDLFLIKTYLPRAIFIIVLWKLSSISVSLLSKSYRECKFTLMPALKFMMDLQRSPTSRRAEFAEPEVV